MHHSPLASLAWSPLVLAALTALGAGCSFQDDDPTGPGDDTTHDIDEQPPVEAPQPGDLALVELQARPLPGEQPWVEVYNRRRVPLTLAGCRLAHGPAADTADEGPWTADEAVTQDGDPAVVPLLGRLVLVAQGCAALPGGTACGLAPAAALATDVPERLRLSCPGPGGASLVIDEVRYDFTAWPGTRGRSLAVAEEQFGLDPAGADDLPQAWCLAVATPAGDNACWPGDVAEGEGEGGEGEGEGSEGEGEGEGSEGEGETPGAGDLAFVEVYGRPATGERPWIELLNVSERTLSVGDCQLTQVKVDSGVTTAKTLGAAEVTPLAPGERLLLMKTSCETAPAETACATYPTIDLRSTKPDRLLLACRPDGSSDERTEVDRIEFVLAERGVEPQQSLLFADDLLGDAPTVANDVATSWCAGPPSPGAANTCP